MIRIGNTYVGGDKPCFVVAEAGLAHMGDVDKAKALVDAAKGAGADAVKFQIYNTVELIDRVRAPEEFDRFKQREMPYSEYDKVKAYADRTGSLCFTTGHTLSAVEHLIKMNTRLYKIGSGERDRRVFDKIANTNKPVFISTGMREHADVLSLVMKYGNKNTAFLHCVSMYPTIDHKAGLGFIRTLARWCDITGSVCGYSDHMAGIDGVQLAVALGAKVIEKHIKLTDFNGRDNVVSLNPKEFGGMVKAIRRVEAMIGGDTREYSGEEKETEGWALKGKDGKRPL